MVIETEEHAKARGATPIARIMGAGITSTPTTVAPVSGRCTCRSGDDRAMELAACPPRTFTTSTRTAPPPDRRHRGANAIRVAGGSMSAVYAPKSAGPSIGAVGASESILTVLSLRDGVIPDAQPRAPDRRLIWMSSRGNPRYGDYQYAIINSFGFGGHNVALAFGRY